LPYDNTTLPACWQDVADVLTAGIDRVLLYGPPGTGKTYAGLTFGDVQAGAFRLVCTEDMTAADVTGCWMPSGDDGWKWLDGQAIKAWRGDGLTGARLIVDEIDKASGDVFALLLAMTDSRESAAWEHPQSGRVERPRDGFSVVMTTNVENLQELPDALLDRFPVRVRINQPHPAALTQLAADLRAYAARSADLGERRISLRAFFAFDQLRSRLGDQDKAARIVFGDRAEGVLDAISVDKVGA
jgi:MoxR-like ATPase